MRIFKVGILISLISILILATIPIFRATAPVFGAYITVGTEPDESSVFGSSDLDITKVKVSDDDTNIYIMFKLGASISTDATRTKMWKAELDIDRGSRSGSWSYDYYFELSLTNTGSWSCYLYDSQGNYVATLSSDAVTGENNFNVTISKSDLTNLGDAFYLKAYSQLGTLDKDVAPYDDTGSNDVGDYYIYYISSPSPTSSWTTQSDSQGDATPAYIDITQVSTAYSGTYLFFKITVSGSIPWSGGSDTANYTIFIDANKDGTDDYKIDYIIGFIPKLYYAGGSWTYLKNVDYTQNPGDSVEISLVVPKSDFNQVPLGSDIKVSAQTSQDSTPKDTTTTFISPVPEYTLFISLTITAVIASILYISRRRSIAKI